MCLHRVQRTLPLLGGPTPMCPQHEQGEVGGGADLEWHRSPRPTFLFLSSNETARRLAQDAVADEGGNGFVALALIEIPQARRLPARQAEIRDRAVFRLDLHRDRQDAIA